MKDHLPTKALIYCRVSDPKQTTRGSGLESQETRCRQYAQYRGYDVIKVFRDSMSGALSERNQLTEMLAYLKRQKEPHAVIVDDISRLARSVEAHIKLRLEIKTAGGKLESPSIEFGEDSDSVLVENMLASVSQHQRQKNAEQTRNRMKARVMNGYWPFNPPVGYRYDRVKGHSGKILVRDEPVASVVQEALEGFAHGRFATQSEVQRFLQNEAAFPKDNSGLVRFQRVTNMLNKVIYCGYLTVPEWNISMLEGKHEALISMETHRRIQGRLEDKAKVPARKDISNDFPLRGFVACGCCGKAMTACWAQGRKAKHPYYMCFGKGCPEYRKSIKRADIEGQFERLLMSMKPSQTLLRVALIMFREIWDDLRDRQEETARVLEKDLVGIDAQVGQFLDRIVETSNPAIVSAYEKRIGDLESQKLLVQEKINQCGRTLPDFDQTFRTGMTLLAKPYEYWASGDMADKVNVLRLCFADNLIYDRNSGFRTARTALPFLVMDDLEGGQYEMAHPRRFELLTF